MKVTIAGIRNRMCYPHTVANGDVNASGRWSDATSCKTRVRKCGFKLSVSLLAVVCILLSVLPGCNTSPLQGLFLTITSHHIYDQSTGPQLGPARILRSGESCSFTAAYLEYFFYGPGQGGVQDAMRRNNIQKIAVIDYSSVNVLYGTFRMECVEVFGE